MPHRFALTPNNILLAASGMDKVLRWDGFSDQAEPAGVLPPATAVTVAGSLAGNIVGTYFAFLRFVDQYGNFSNLSPVSAEFDAAGVSGAITAASADTPIVITSAAHGLTTGILVKNQNVIGNDDAVGVFAITVIDVNRFSLDGTSGQTAGAGGTWTTGVGLVTYSGVAVPVEGKVRRRQVLRNTDGQASVFYVDVDTTDLTSTSLTSTRVDSNLSTQASQPLLDTDGRDIANRFTVPPDWTRFVLDHQDRTLYFGEEPYAEGNVAVTYGSAAVAGVNTDWGEALAGRLLYVDGAPAAALIASVDAVAQTLALAAPYQGPTSAYSFYAIRADRGQRRLVYFSEPGLPEAVPATNAVSVQEDGDEFTGGVVFRSFAYILERHHVYKMSWSESPAKDGGIFLSALRGCVSDRCCVVVNDKAYMLDEQGVHAFGGSGDDQSVSAQIQGLFRPEPAAHYRVNWDGQRFFHAALFATQETIRWYVCLEGDYLPRHALCYAYTMNRWWVERYPVPVSASCLGKAAAGVGTWRAKTDQVYLGSAARAVLAPGAQRLDGASPAGTTRGMVTSATWLTLTDSSARFTAAAGVPVVIVAGRGKGQSRQVSAASAGTIAVTQPWTTLPDETSVYQVGGVPWFFRTGWFAWAATEQQNPRAIDVNFAPSPVPAEFTVRRYDDFSDAPAESGFTSTQEQAQGLAATKGSPDLVADMTKSNAFVRRRMDGRSEGESDGQRFFQVELLGVGGDHQTAIYDVGLDGAAK